MKYTMQKMLVLLVVVLGFMPMGAFANDAPVDAAVVVALDVSGSMGTPAWREKTPYSQQLAVQQQQAFVAALRNVALRTREECWKPTNMMVFSWNDNIAGTTGWHVLHSAEDALILATEIGSEVVEVAGGTNLLGMHDDVVSYLSQQTAVERRIAIISTNGNDPWPRRFQRQFPQSAGIELFILALMDLGANQYAEELAGWNAYKIESEEAIRPAFEKILMNIFNRCGAMM